MLLEKLKQQLHRLLRRRDVPATTDSDFTTHWNWEFGRIDEHAEHILISYGDLSEISVESLQPIARLSPPDKCLFTVELLPTIDDLGCREELERQLDFYLLEHGLPEPWHYALHHCATAANIYSRLHWSHRPGDAMV